MNHQIRPLIAEDYPAVTRIYNAQNEPHHQTTEQELRSSYERAQERSFFRLLTAVQDGDVSAYGQFGERAGDNPPGKYWAWFFVRPDRVGQGADTALHDAAVDILADRDPKSLWTCIREDFVPAASYLGERDYEEQFRSWGANLDLAGFDPAAFQPYRSALAERGIELELGDIASELRTYAELVSDPQRDAKLAELQAELEEDAPHHEPIIPKNHPTPQHPKVLLDSYVVAVDGDRYVGLASLTGQKDWPTVPGSGLTGVRREYRGQGIGTALLAHTSTWAKEQGYDIQVGVFPWIANGRALTAGDTEGFVKVIRDKKYSEVLGAHIVGPHATELIAEFVVGRHLETTVEEMEKAMHPHPTLSEAVADAALAAKADRVAEWDRILAA